MSTQADKIRTIAINILKKQTDANVSPSEPLGIRYSKLKEILLSDKMPDFTEGAVTGALYTLPDRVPNIYKKKIKGGTFFYYSESEKKMVDGSLNSITTSNDYKELINFTKKTETKVNEILTKASKDAYIQTTELDIEYLRKILYLASQLSGTLKLYETDRSLEQIEVVRRSSDTNASF